MQLFHMEHKMAVSFIFVSQKEMLCVFGKVIGNRLEAIKTFYVEQKL